MAATARLRHGADLIYFEDGTAYQLADDFTPPGSSLAAAFSAGSSANRYGGAEKIDEKADNRQIDFTVICSVSTKDNAGPQSLANRLITMLTAAGDDNNPVWFEWTLTPDLPEPVWGQFGAWRRAEVVHAGGRYATSIGSYSRNENVEVIVSLTVKPFALGTRQFPASVTTITYNDGPLSVDYFGENSFTQTGLRSGQAVTNKITNPIFGNRTAYDTGWSAVGLTAYKTLDLNYVFPGAEVSAQLVASTADGTFTQSINSANTNAHWLSAYVKKTDSAAVTSADCELYYAGNALATTFRLLGNGVYWAYATANGTASADAVGIQVKANKSIYLMAFQYEENAVHQTWLACGDFPGYTWSGTAHASSSVNTSPTGGYLFMPALNRDYAGGYSVGVVFRADYPSTEADTDNWVFWANTGGGTFSYQPSTDRFLFQSVSSSAETFAAGDTIRLVVTTDPTSSNIYVNGVLVGTGADWNAPSNLFVIGAADSGSTNPLPGIIKAFEIYDKKLSASEVTLLDNAFLSCISEDYIDPPMMAGNNGMYQIPSSTQPWKSYGFVDCIPGNAPPLFDIETFTYSGIATDAELKFSTIPIQHINFAPTGLMYDSSSAAISVATSADEVLATWTVYRLNEIMGKTVWVAARLTDAGSNLQLDFKLTLGGTSVRIGYANVVADATMRMFYLGPLYIPSRAGFPDRAIVNSNVQATATLYAQRSTGAAANVELDYVSIMLPNYTRLIRTSAAAITTPVLNYWDGQGAVFYDDTTPAEYLRMIGDKITVWPMVRNLIHFQPGTNATDNSTTRSFNLTMYITPRWAL